MADVRDDSTQQILRKIIREEVRPIILEEMRPIIRQEVRPIMREELAPIKLVQSQQGLQLRDIKTTLRQHGDEIRRTAVLLEDLDDRFKAAAEIS